MTILLSGMMAADPYQGGATWAVLQYLLGLRQLGHEVYFVEPVQPAALQPNHASLEATANAVYFDILRDQFDLAQTGALLLGGTQQTYGLSYAELQDIAQRADLLINISGVLTDTELTRSIPRRVYLDLDPAFNQMWQAVQGIDRGFAGHTDFVTVGLAIGQSNCEVPTCGYDWITTLQPVVLSKWPIANEIAYNGLTTIGNWRGYGSIEQEGVFYGQKAHSWRSFMELPRRSTARFMPALAIHPDETKDLAALRDYGWELLDPARVAATPMDYQQFIQGSKAELGIAKSGYMASCCGWFSDRSTCYLASGRPVIAHDTGFSRFLPTGQGLFAFSTIDEAVTAIEMMDRDYTRHARAARSLAEEYFDSDRVLTRLLQRLGLG